jgi:hypothetical protein
MLCRMISVILALTLVCALPEISSAAPRTDKSAQTSAQGPRRHLANIVFAGLAGAVLGLSTLSFYGRPQDRLSNIAVGFAIGVIVGTVYTTYKAAVEPRDFYGLNPEKHDTTSVALWSVAEEGHRSLPRATPGTSFSFEF